MEDNKIKVYIKTDKNNCIKDINSSIFLTDIADYIKIDEGFGDKYCHAQGNYLQNGLMDSQGNYNYKYENDKIVELTDKEKEVLFPKQEIQTEENLIDKLILDNINMQMQIDSLIESQLGGI